MKKVWGTRVGIRLMVVLAVCWGLLGFMSLEAKAEEQTRETMMLNGTWDFYPNNGGEQYDIQVPSYWDLPTPYEYPDEWNALYYGVYRKDFELPSTMEGKEIFLNLDSISVLSKVYVNGQEITAQQTDGYYLNALTYRLDVTSLVGTGTNTLEIHVWGLIDAPSDVWIGGKLAFPLGDDSAWYGAGRGIGGDIYIEARPKVYVSDVYVAPDLKKNTDPSDDTINVEYKVTNSTTTSQTIVLKNEAALVGGDTEKIFDEATITLAPGESRKIVLSQVSWTDAKYWWTYDPKLYMLNTRVLQGDEVVDQVGTRFGYRQFNVENNYYELNGVKTNLRGDSLELSWHIESFNGPFEGAGLSFKDANIQHVKKMLDEVQKLNFNVVRTHKGRAIKEFYEYADEIGMLVICETSFINLRTNTYSTSTQSMNRIREWVKKWVDGYKNHPSIVLWSGSNECWDSGMNYYLMPAINQSIKERDTTRPIIHDGNNMEDQNNTHYYGGYPANKLDYYNMYSVYYNDPSKPRGEGEAYTPTKGWPLLNANGTMRDTKNGRFVTNPDLMAQGARYKSVGRMVRAMRYAGFSDIRPYANWRYAFEVIEDVMHPTWEDKTAPGTKPKNISRPIFNVFDNTKEEVIKSTAYEYIKDTYSAVAVFDKYGDRDNRVGIAPAVFNGGSQTTRTLIIYNDEQRDGTVIDVNWEAGYYDPATDSYVSFQSGSFAANVAYGNKAERTINFTVPNGVSGKWLQLKLTGSKEGITKFEEVNRIGAIGGQPAAKLQAKTSNNSDLGVIDTEDMEQARKIILRNIGGGTSVLWTADHVPAWMDITFTSGNLRDEQELYFKVKTDGLEPNTEYSETITFTEAGGSSDTVTITFRTDSNPKKYTGNASPDFDSENLSGWTTERGSWGFMGDQIIISQTDATAAGADYIHNGSQGQDQTISAKVKVDQFNGLYSGIGFSTRFKDKNNLYNFTFYNKTKTLQIQKRFNGTWTVISSKPFAINTGVWYDLKAVTVGNNLEFWVNGVKELTATDGDLTEGKVVLATHRVKATFKDITPDSVPTDWTKTKGTWVATSNKAYKQSDLTAEEASLLKINGGWENFSVESVLELNEVDGTESSVGLLARYVNQDNTYGFFYSQEGLLVIKKKVQGQWTELASKSYTMELGRRYTFKATLEDNALSFWVDGTKELTVNDNSFTSGTAGLYGNKVVMTVDELQIENAKDVIDLSHGGYNMTGRAFGLSSGEAKRWQIFSVDGDAKLTGVDVKIKKQDNENPRDLLVELYEVSNNKPVGNAIASTTVSSDEFVQWPLVKTASLSYDGLQANKQYAIVLGQVGLASTGYDCFTYQVATNYPSGKYTGSQWIDESSIGDIWMKIYTETKY